MDRHADVAASGHRAFSHAQRRLILTEFSHRSPAVHRCSDFRAAAEAGGTIYHLDMKKEPGVDIVGDLFDPKFLDKIRGMEIRSVLMSNPARTRHQPTRRV